MPLVLFNPKIGPYQVLPLRARVDLGPIAMKGCSVFPKAPALREKSPSDFLQPYPGHSLGGGLKPLQRCSQCILQPEPTGKIYMCVCVRVKFIRKIFFFLCIVRLVLLGFVCSNSGLRCLMAYQPLWVIYGIIKISARYIIPTSVRGILNYQYMKDVKIQATNGVKNRTNQCIFLGKYS